MRKPLHTSGIPLLALILVGTMVSSPAAWAAQEKTAPESISPATPADPAPEIAVPTSANPVPESQPAPQEDVALSFSFTPQEIVIGKPLTCTIVARWKPPVRVHPFSLPGHVGDFEVLRTTSSQVKAEGKDGTQTQVFGVQLTCFEVGEKKLPSIELQYSVGEGELKTAATSPQSIQVKSYLERLALEKKPGEQVGLRDIKPPLEMPYPLRRALAIAGIALAALLIGIAFVYLLGRWLLRPVRKTAPAPPPLPPDVEALQALAQLELEDAARREAAKPYYSKLSEILRRYLGRRYTFDALEMTSGELLERARSLGWSAELLTSLVQDTQESDSVKFARYVPAPPLRVGALERVRGVVVGTRFVQSPGAAEPTRPGEAQG